MSNKIKGSPELLEKVRRATPFNTNIHVNLEALKELPEQYDAVLKAVHFNPNDLEKSFTKISGKYMPKTQLMYDIAEARGVRGSNFFIAEDVYQEVNINPMFCKSLLDQPTMRKIHTGCSSTKQAIVTEEDGTESTGSPCTVIDSFWSECLKMWAKEEESTEGYSKVLDGKYKVFEYGKNVEKTGRHYLDDTKYKNAHPIKFDTQWKRQSFYESQKDLSQNMAQTKSWLKCIREKAGLITAYDPKDLESGELIFSKIVKSSASLKMESLAHMESIAKGTQSKEKQNILFGTEKNVTENVDVATSGEDKQVETIIEPPTATPVEEAIAEIDCYFNSPYCADDNFKKKLSGALGWLRKTPDADKTDVWATLLADLEVIRGMMG